MNSCTVGLARLKSMGKLVLPFAENSTDSLLVLNSFRWGGGYDNACQAILLINHKTARLMRMHIILSAGRFDTSEKKFFKTSAQSASEFRRD